MVYQTMPLPMANRDRVNHTALLGKLTLKEAKTKIKSPVKPSKMESFLESENDDEVSPVIEIF